ncbi:MFS transporter [Nonomuraea sp. NPDC051191]|uniref:MFS transporter n=1 Tax=Nonomuraea sp. NPDC051191 TaxID=3364372 RepID=UPI0037A3EEE8
MTVVVPLLPGLEQQLHVPSTTVSWTLTAGLLSGAVSIPLLARLGDMYGRRTTSLVALGLLVAGSTLSALAGTLPLLIAGRVLQGTAAPLLTLAMGLVRQVVPGHRLPSAIWWRPWCGRRRRADPDGRTWPGRRWSRYGSSACCWPSALLGFALFAAITTVSAVAQGALGASVLQVGIYLLPTTVLMLVVSVLAGPLMRRFTAAALVAGGSVLVSAAALWLAVSRSSGADLYGAATLLGLGIGLGYAALGTMAVEHVEPAKTAAAGGVNALVRVVGSSAAGAVGAAVLSSGGAGWTFGIAAGAALLAALFSAVHGNLSRQELA